MPKSDDKRQKQPKHNKSISLNPLTFEEALRGLLETPPPPKKKGAGKKKSQQSVPSESNESCAG